MADEPRHYVRIDTGYGPPGDALQPIELHVADADGTLRLSAPEAELLATQLRTAAQAVRVLTGKPSPVSVPTVRTPSLIPNATLAADWCAKCGAIVPTGYDCRSITCPRLLKVTSTAIPTTAAGTTHTITPCGRCGAIRMDGSFCKAMDCPINPGAKAATAPTFDQRREDEKAEGALLAARLRAGSTA